MTRHQLLSRVVFVLGTMYFVLLLSSCENDIRTIKLLTSPDKLPVETEKDVELLYSDSAKLKLRLKAPELNRYEGPPAYIELPKGVALTFYDDSMKVKSMITANYAKRNLDDGRMEARNNVVVVNERNDKLFTEHLVYDEKSEPQIHTNANVTIITADDTLYGKGLESNRDFTKYRIISPVVSHTVRDTLEEE
jgi:LPS export ABC transporter protein LptC